MQTQILSLITPLFAAIFATVFGALWWRDRSRRYVGGIAAAYALFVGGLIISYFSSAPGGTVTVLLVHAIFSASVLTFIWAAVGRVGQALPLAPQIGISLIAGMLLWYASLSDDQYSRLYVQGSATGLLFALAALTLWRAASRSTIDRAIAWLFVLLSAQFFIRPQLAMMAGGRMTIESYRTSAFYSIHVAALALCALLIAMAFLAAILDDQQQAQKNRLESDPLTGLQMRRAFEADAAVMLIRASEQNVPVSMIVADIDHFKAINDRWGHSVGDQVIKAFGKLVEQKTRKRDLTGRIGGEEFCILVWNCALGPSKGLAERIRQALAGQKNFGIAAELDLSGSFGVAQLRKRESYSSLFERADRALYRAKERGRNRVEAADAAEGDLNDGASAEVVSIALLSNRRGSNRLAGSNWR